MNNVTHMACQNCGCLTPVFVCQKKLTVTTKNGDEVLFSAVHMSCAECGQYGLMFGHIEEGVGTTNDSAPEDVLH
jgi:RNase P subunit RPR2